MNDDQQAKILGFFKVALGIIEASAEMTPLPLEARVTPVFITDNPPLQLRRVVSRSYITDMFFETLLQRDETTQAAMCLIDGNFTPPIVIEAGDQGEGDSPQTAKVRVCLAKYLMPMLGDYIDKHRTLEYVELGVLEVVEEHVISWSQTTATYKVIVPLVNFEADFTELALPNGLSIQRFSPEEKGTLWTSVWGWQGLKVTDFVNCHFKLFATFEAPIDEQRVLPDDLMDAILHTGTSLRLTQSGGVGLLGIFRRICPPIIHHPEMVKFSLIDMCDGDGEDSDPFRLTAESTDRFLSILERMGELSRASILRPLGFAIRWFDKAYSNRAREDKIIYHAIALESTLLADLDVELSYRIGLRGAALLNKKRVPDETVKILRALYRARSRIVHMGDTLYSIAKQGQVYDFPVETFVPVVEGVVRDVLTEYLSRIAEGVKIEDINKSLESLIIDGLNDT